MISRMSLVIIDWNRSEILRFHYLIIDKQKIVLRIIRLFPNIANSHIHKKLQLIKMINNRQDQF